MNGLFRMVLLATVAIGILSLGSAANGGDVYNNLPLPSWSGGTDPVSVDGPSFNSFSTGNSDSFLLDIKMMLSGISTTPGSLQFTVSLLSDASNSPGTFLTSLGTFDDSTLASTASVYDVPVNTTIALTADTRYWVELSGPSSSVAWDYAIDARGAGVSGEYSAYSSPGGPIVSQNASGSGPYQMEVTTTQSTDLPALPPDLPPQPEPTPPVPGTPSVPEHGTLCQVLSAFGIGVVAMMRRRMVRS